MTHGRHFTLLTTFNQTFNHDKVEWLRGLNPIFVKWLKGISQRASGKKIYSFRESYVLRGEQSEFSFNHLTKTAQRHETSKESLVKCPVKRRLNVVKRATYRGKR